MIALIVLAAFAFGLWVSGRIETVWNVEYFPPPTDTGWNL